MKFWFTHSLIALAVLQLGSAVFAVYVLLCEDSSGIVLIPELVRVTTSFVFGSIGAVLLVIDRSVSSRHLVACFLLIAVSYSSPIARSVFENTDSRTFYLFSILLRLSIDAILAYQAWAYFRSYFLKPPPWISKTVECMKALSLLAGIFLLVVNISPELVDSSNLQQFLRNGENSRFHLWAYIFLLPFFPAMVAMYFHSSALELRKLSVLVLGIGFTLPPLAIIIAFPLDAEFQTFVRQPVPSAFLVSGMNLVLMFSPLTMAYATVVFGQQDSDGTKSNAVLYRISLALVYSFMLVPMIGVAWFFYSLRELQLSTLFQDSRAYLLILCLGLTLSLYLNRSKLTQHITTLFNRTNYNAESTYSEINDAAHGALDIPELLARAARTISDAFHSSTFSACVYDPYHKTLRSLNGPRIDVEIDEGTYLALGVKGCVLIGGDCFGGGKAVLIIRNNSKELCACLIFGRRKNGEEYDREDRKFMVMVQEMLESSVSRMLFDVNNPAHDFLIPFEAARECLTCHNLYTPQQESCPECDASLMLSAIPYLLNRKYRLVSKLGMGEFGQVYLGTDNSLARKVAIKSLPETASGIEQEYLEKEALMMARVSHPNLAIVYGIEFWHSRPLLVVEYLPGGTLADRLTDGGEGIDKSNIIKNLCGAVKYTHDEGVLHLDIKPSNIGFSKQMDIKLLDFGTAHLVKSMADSYASVNTQEITIEEAKKTSVSRSILGTPIYMSPEAHRGEPPQKSFDLWSLTVVIVELLTGQHPFERDTWGETHMSIVKGNASVPNWVSPEAKKLIRERMLNADCSRRPKSAEELKELFEKEWSVS